MKAQKITALIAILMVCFVFVATAQSSFDSGVDVETITMADVSLENLELTGIVANTVVLNSGAILQANPITGEPIIPGDVNFTTDVIYGAAPTQNFIGNGIIVINPDGIVLPEPGTTALLALGLSGAVWLQKRRGNS